MARLLVDAGADVAREPIRALMLSLAPSKVPPLLPWLAHVDAVLGSEVAIELLRRHPDEPDIVAAALVVVLDPARTAGARALRGFAERGSAQEPRASPTAISAASARPRRADAAHVRHGLVGALSRGPGADAAEGHDRRTGSMRCARMLTDQYARDMLEHVRAEATIA